VNGIRLTVNIGIDADHESIVRRKVHGDTKKQNMGQLFAPVFMGFRCPSATNNPDKPTFPDKSANSTARESAKTIA